jgi:hypothetical protein
VSFAQADVTTAAALFPHTGYPFHSERRSRQESVVQVFVIPNGKAVRNPLFRFLSFRTEKPSGIRCSGFVIPNGEAERNLLFRFLSFRTAKPSGIRCSGFCHSERRSRQESVVQVFVIPNGEAVRNLLFRFLSFRTAKP